MSVTTKVFVNESGTILAKLTEGEHTIEIDMSEFSKLQDKVEKCMFGKNVHIMYRPKNDIVPPMYEGEMHDLLFQMPYDEGTNFSRNIAVVMAKECDNRINTNSPLTFGEMLETMRVLLANSRAGLMESYG